MGKTTQNGLFEVIQVVTIDLDPGNLVRNGYQFKSFPVRAEVKIYTLVHNALSLIPGKAS